MLTHDQCREWLNSGALISCNDGKVVIGWGEPTSASAWKPDSHVPQYFFPDFFLTDSHPWHTFASWSVVDCASLIDSLKTYCVPQSVIPWKPADENAFNAGFDQLQSLFATKALKKGVPYCFQSTALKMETPRLAASMSQALTYVQTRPAFIYGIWNKNEGVIGVTPEVLFRNDDRQLETMACAGTASLDCSADAFLSDPKERHEHALVIEDILNCLRSYGSLFCGETCTRPFGRIQHLVTPITLELNKPADFSALVTALHPTAALGAYPRAEGMKWLKDFNASNERGRFGAPAGCVLPESRYAMCYVAIRNVQWDRRGMKIGAGCGVIPESSREREWQEVKRKLESIKEVLSL